MELSVVDLGLGNLHSVVSAAHRVGAKATIIRGAEAIGRASRILVPGQGAFGDGTRALSGPGEADGVGEALLERIAAGVPYLGICLGMQLLFERSEEAPGAQGLGLFRGECRKFVAAPERKVPHMGWNVASSAHPFIDDGGYYYFVHSYYCVPEDKTLVAATADYDGAFCAAVAQDNVLATQFHPEKSQRRGESLLRRFLESP